jgi:hypothetical protein
VDISSRLAKIVPTLDEYCAGENAQPLTDLQKVALGSLLFLLFDGITESIESMATCFEAIAPFEGAPSIGDEALEWLAKRDDLGPAQ